jgi:Flp pilus assembly protein TadG
MSKRKKNSSGQAIVMVTLALFSMMGMMGLAVDLGWSYFTQKQAQAAADTAALAAAQEAVKRLGVGSDISGFNCGSTGTSANQVECTEQPGATALEYCGSSVVSTSNLNNGCLYAKRNGFQYDVAGSKQIVSVQSGDATDVNVPPGLKRISYWVRVRTIQTVPQLFSFVAGHHNGTVAANGTAAIAGAITPGSFFGMDRAGDCLTGSDVGNCGLDFDTGHGKGKGKAGSQACGPNNINSDLCAPAGIILASSCNGVGTGCNQVAGIEHTTAVASSLTIMGPSGSVTGTVDDLSGNPLTATHTTNASTFADPTAPNSQPPLATSGSSIGTCAIPHAPGTTQATIPGNATLGPYLYYSYSALAGGKPVPDGVPIVVSGSTTFSQGAGSLGASASCPAVSAGTLNTIQTGGAANQTNANFPTYIFVGGLSNSGTMTIGPGQYVMAGTNNASNGMVFTNSGTINGASAAAKATGSLFIFTDAAYPGMNLSSNTAANFTPLVTGGTALNQGSIDIQNNSDITMYGLVNSAVGGNLPPAMNVDTGLVWWQDRRNSTVGYNEAPGSPGCSANCTGDDGSVISCGIGCLEGSSSTTNTLATANHVRPNSPGVQWSNGNTKVALNGVYYQPRGAWLHFGNGNTGFNCSASAGRCPLQVVTGALLMDNGATRMVLLGPNNPLITYRAVLVQ